MYEHFFYLNWIIIGIIFLVSSITAAIITSKYDINGGDHDLFVIFCTILVYSFIQSMFYVFLQTFINIKNLKNLKNHSEQPVEEV